MGSYINIARFQEFKTFVKALLLKNQTLQIQLCDFTDFFLCGVAEPHTYKESTRQLCDIPGPPLEFFFWYF